MDSTAVEPFHFYRLPLSGAPRLPGVSCVEGQFTVGAVVIDTLSEYGIDPPINFSTMVNKRRSEYLAGRLCARLALRDAGSLKPAQVSSLPDRRPVWPEGWIGSISHCTGRALAVVAQSGRRLGVDMEGLISASTACNLAEHILCPEDRLAPSQPFEVALTIVFSAKEALFKALYPDVKRFFGFEAAAVTGYGGGELRLQLQEDLSDRWQQGQAVTAYWSLAAGRVYSLVYVNAPDQGGDPSEVPDEAVEQGRRR